MDLELAIPAIDLKKRQVLRTRSKSRAAMRSAFGLTGEKHIVLDLSVRTHENRSRAFVNRSTMSETSIQRRTQLSTPLVNRFRACWTGDHRRWYWFSWISSRTEPNPCRPFSYRNALARALAPRLAGGGTDLSPYCDDSAALSSTPQSIARLCFHATRRRPRRVPG